MSYYGKYEDEDSYEEELIRKVKKAVRKKKEYSGGNIRVIKAAQEKQNKDIW